MRKSKFNSDVVARLRVELRSGALQASAVTTLATLPKENRYLWALRDSNP